MLLEYLPPEKVAYEEISMIRQTICAIAVMLAVALTASAQSYRSSIRGRVEDPSGAVVTGAEIVAINEATGDERAVTTSDAGAFAIPELEPGAWRVQIST